ncbi:MAG: phenylalanine--tRNA ligase subunit beta [Thaumarchaeota archaeon]|nr:phenylalanine--tRNA ligase subunit beta [Nitrososphaerota archaeon]
MLKGQVSKKKLEETIPYLGLDIEEVAEDYLRIEYNPNRPDFATHYGIAKALNSFLELQTEWRDYDVSKGKISVKVDKSVQSIRPFIVAAVARNIKLDDESIRQIITIQEDLHNGIGRMRKKVSIGIHNLDVLKPPLEYLAVDPTFAFVPLNETKNMSMQDILTMTSTGREYAHLVNQFGKYPLLRDSAGGVLSFPPIINGELTRLSSSTKNLFIDITATDLKTAENALAILVTTLSDAGASIESVKVEYHDRNLMAPDLSVRQEAVDIEYANTLLGLQLTKEEMVRSLRRARLQAKADSHRIVAKVPRYRIDIIHPVDLVEEIALGYGIFRIEPSLPASKAVGKYNELQVELSRVRDIMTGLGMLEVVNFSLVGEDLLRNAGMDTQLIRVDKSKSAEHEVLRPSILPTILLTFSKNIHEEYPQKIFEIGKVFTKKEGAINEEYRLAGAVSHSSANFTEIHSYLSALVKHVFGAEVLTKTAKMLPFLGGRTAEIVYNGRDCGSIGEIHPEVLYNLGMRNPIAAFELKLSSFIRG